MDVTLALIADAANISQEGKLNVLGTFNNINASTFPCVQPSMVLVTRFEASRTEIGLTKQFEMKLLDPDGQSLGSASGSFVVPDAPAGQRVALNNILPLNMVAFQRPGPHHFVVMISGETKAEVPVTVNDSSAMEITDDAHS